jgi:hypothetical protein
MNSNQKEAKFMSPEKFISNIQEEGRSLDLLNVLLAMEETVTDSRNKTLVYIFLQPTHMLTLKTLKKIVNKEFPGKGATYLMKTVWYNESAIILSKRAFFTLLIAIAIFVILYILTTLGFESLPFLSIVKINKLMLYSILFILFCLTIHLLCYWIVIFKLLKTFDWLKDLMVKSCESTIDSLDRGKKSFDRYKERVKAIENESEISRYMSVVVNELAKHQYENCKSTADFLEYLKVRVDDDQPASPEENTSNEGSQLAPQEGDPKGQSQVSEENTSNEGSQLAPQEGDPKGQSQVSKEISILDKAKSMFIKKDSHFFRNDNGRKLEETISRDEKEYLQTEKVNIKNQHIVDDAAIVMYSMKNILDIIKGVEKELANAILREDEYSQERKKIEDYQKDMKRKEKEIAFGLSLIESGGEEGLRALKMNQFLELIGLYKEGNTLISAEVVQIIENNHREVIAKNNN